VEPTLESFVISPQKRGDPRVNRPFHCGDLPAHWGSASSLHMPPPLVCRAAALLLTAVLVGGPLQMGEASAQLPDSPEALVAELGRVLTAKDVGAYAALLSDDYVFTPHIEVGPEPLDRAADIEITRRFLAATEIFEAEFQVESETALGEGVSLRLRSDFLATDGAGNGHRLSGFTQELLAVDTSSGWQVAALTDQPVAGGLAGGPASSWHAMRLEYAARSTAVSDVTWGRIKEVQAEAQDRRDTR